LINRPILAVDSILITKDFKFVFVRRKNEPFKGKLAFPGGMVEYGETIEQAVKREIKEETGLEVEISDLLGVYSDPGRDPRGHIVSVVVICKEIGGELKAGSDAEEVLAIEQDNIPREELAFDHAKILKDAAF
jgi:8-oxo-dGTP diphosphatase